MQSVQKIELNEGWKIKNPVRKIEMQTIIPSSVFEELIKEKIIPDPFYGLEELTVNWVYESEWEYECEFDISTQFLAHPDILLRFYGLDTFSTITLNDQQLGTTENMHRT
jgi:beta-mannosidase